MLLTTLTPDTNAWRSIVRRSDSSIYTEAHNDISARFIHHAKILSELKSYPIPPLPPPARFSRRAFPLLRVFTSRRTPPRTAWPSTPALTATTRTEPCPTCRACARGPASGPLPSTTRRPSERCWPRGGAENRTSC